MLLEDVFTKFPGRRIMVSFSQKIIAKTSLPCNTQLIGPLRLAHVVLLCCIGVLGSGLATANPAEDGDVTITLANQEINGYTTLSAAATAGAGTLTVATIANLDLPASSGVVVGNRPLAAGDLLLIYQAQELAGSITTTNTSSAFGTVTNYGQAGLYEFVYVESIAGSVITIDTSDGDGPSCNGLQNSYDAGAQVIRVPQYRSLTVASGASVVARPWSGTVGGVVVADIRPGTTGGPGAGLLSINGTGVITASGRGFRGGALENSLFGGGTNNETRYALGTCAIGARKGESIMGFAGTTFTCDPPTGTGITGSYVGQAFGRGALANGGGGGNEHNGGGGGGANAGTGTWTGSGIPDRGPGNSYDTFWNLEVAGFATSTSSGGGRGGYTWGSNNPASSTPPGNSAWAGNFRRPHGGLGGRPLDRRPAGESFDRLYFGGGGGAADQNNGNGGAGGAGGGLVFLIAHRIQTNVVDAGAEITANGAAGGNTITANQHNDGAGGAGGGGTVVLLLGPNAPSDGSIDIEANGGAGGNQAGNPTGQETEGPGGGGGGGLIAFSGGAGAPDRSVLGGVNGISVAPETSFLPPNGATRGAPGELVAAPARNSPPFACVRDGEGPFSTAVTNAYVKVEKRGNRLAIEFESSAEVGNLGYRVYGVTADGAETLLGFIEGAPGGSVDSKAYVADYADAGYAQVYVADVDILGRETRRGPFLPGRSYGERGALEAYDWSVARGELASLRAPAGVADAAYAEVRQAGMQRVDHEDLLAAGIDLSGTSADAIAVVGRSGPIARRIRGPASFGAGSTIEFHATPGDRKYADHERYLIVVDADRVLPLPTRDLNLSVAAGTPAHQLHTVRNAAQGLYNFSSPLSDPFHVRSILANGAAIQWTQSFVLSAPLSAEGEVLVRVVGGQDWPAGALPDHHVEVYVNDLLVASERFDGLVASNIRVPVGNLQAGNNDIRLRLPLDTGNPQDLVYVEEVALSYWRQPAVTGDAFHGTGLTATDAVRDVFFRDGFGDDPGVPHDPPQPRVSVAGAAAVERGFVIDGLRVEELDLSRGSGLLGMSSSSELWLSTADQLLRPALVPAPALVSSPSASADYWVVSHPLFVDALTPLLAHRSAEGLRTRLVDIEQIYRRYSAGNASPEAITRFVREHAYPLGARYLLLVGGDTYDAAGHLGSASISFIPTPYTQTNSIVFHAPADGLYGDIGGDFIPEIAVGRLPVRTIAEAIEAVRRILDYEDQSSVSTALLASGRTDSTLGLDFDAAFDASFGSLLQTPWVVSVLSSDDFADPADARQALMAAFTAGQSVVGYMGHSSPGRWGFEGILRSTDVAALSPTAAQPIVLQFACWTTYFALPSANAMVHALMLTPDRGASAILGSTVLLTQPSHEAMASAMAPLLTSGTRLGDALLEVKQLLGATMDTFDGTEVLAGTTLVGDPAQQLR